MGTEPQKPLSPQDVERLELENEALRAANKHLREQLERLAERQRELAREHAVLEDTFRRLTAKSRNKPGGEAG